MGGATIAKLNIAIGARQRIDAVHHEQRVVDDEVFNLRVEDVEHHVMDEIGVRDEDGIDLAIRGVSTGALELGPDDVCLLVGDSLGFRVGNPLASEPGRGFIPVDAPRGLAAGLQQLGELDLAARCLADLPGIERQNLLETGCDWDAGIDARGLFGIPGGHENDLFREPVFESRMRVVFIKQHAASVPIDPDGVHQ